MNWSKWLSSFSCTVDNVGMSFCVKRCHNPKVRLTLRQLSVLSGLQSPQVSGNCLPWGRAVCFSAVALFLRPIEALVRNPFTCSDA